MYIKNKEIVYHDQAIQIENLKIHNVIILFLDEDKDEFENDFIKKWYTNVLPNTGIDSI